VQAEPSAAAARSAEETALATRALDADKEAARRQQVDLTIVGIPLGELAPPTRPPATNVG
jgi:hypothetical protein